MDICLLRLVLDSGNATKNIENMLALFCKCTSSEYQLVGM